MILCKIPYSSFINKHILNKFLKRNLSENELLKAPNIKQFLWNDLLEKNTKYSNDDKFIKVVTLNGHSNYKLNEKPTPYTIMQKNNNQLLNSFLICKVNGLFWDLNKPLVNDSNIEFLLFENDIARDAFWRSTAFLLNGIIEHLFHSETYRSHSNEKGFICDFILKNKSICSLEFQSIEDKFMNCVASHLDFERIDIPVEIAKDLFSFSAMKLNLIERLHAESKPISLYRCSNFIDICEAPLVRNTEQLQYIKIIRSGSVQMDSNDKCNSLQRIYGVSYPNKELFDGWLLQQEEAGKRNHRLIGEEQELFFFHNSSPGSAFMLPRGTHICNKLIDLIREQYRKRGFSEVTTPQIFKNELWETSGHLDHYQENLFRISLKSKELFSIKPMNCPAHCLIYSHKQRYSKDLPIRLADFGALHRFELTGSLSGLTRLRKFHQDDAHIFCRSDQIEQEIEGSLDFIKYVYGILNFEFDLYLSTRPDHFLGDIEMWDLAEEQLKKSLDKFGKSWSLNSGDGAFYGPKIDVVIKDALNRRHQCATIQLDFQLPLRFNLKYLQNEGSFERPVIIHRAIFGSVERFLAILIESNSGKWPFWLNPRQVLVIPVSIKFIQYANEVCQQIKDEGFLCDADLSDLRMHKKILNGELQRYNCILIVGQKELDNRQVSVRKRNDENHELWNLQELIKQFKYWEKNRTFDIRKK